MQKILMVLIGFLTLVAMFIIGVDLIPKSATSDAELIIGKPVTYTEFLDANLIDNPNFDTLTPQSWSISPINKGTVGITDHYLHASIANTQFKTLYYVLTGEVTVDDYVYVSFDYRITQLGDNYVLFNIGQYGPGNPRIYDTDDEWHTYTIVAQSGTEISGILYLLLSTSDLSYPFDDTTMTIDIDNVQIVNLTTVFGEGQEPSQELLLARINALESQGDYYYEGWDLFVLIMLIISVVSMSLLLYLYSSGGLYE